MTRKKQLAKRGLAQAMVTTLIDYYLPDMQPRGHTRDSLLDLIHPEQAPVVCFQLAAWDDGVDSPHLSSTSRMI